MITENEASKRACELIRKRYLTEEEINVGAFDDDFLIERYSDEWSWFMEGWKETKIAFTKQTTPICGKS